MDSEYLYDEGGHKNILLDIEHKGLAVDANIHLIIHNGHGLILDPGGPKAYRQAYPEVLSLMGRGSLDYIFFSHQDPDIVAAVNGWLSGTNAQALVSSLWTRFVPHFGLNKLLGESLTAIPDEGMRLDLAGVELLVIPGHFLHSCGNFQIYDPISKILYTGDLGASIEPDYAVVQDFDAHAKGMLGFHRRYMASGLMMKAWARMARTLDVETIAPQHGARFEGKEMVARFIQWCETVECGVDWLAAKMTVPA